MPKPVDDPLPDDDEFLAGWDEANEDAEDPPADPEKPEGDDAVDDPDPDANKDDGGGDDDKDGDPPADGDGDDKAGDPPKADDDDGGKGDPPSEGDPPEDDILKTVSEVRDETRKNFDSLHRLLKDEKKRAPVEPPPADTPPAPSTKRINVSEYTGDSLKQKLQKVKEADPELAESLEGLIAPLATGLEAAYTENDTIRVSTEARQAKAVELARYGKVKAKHPDFEEVVKTDEFTSWLDEQPSYVKRTAHTTEEPGEFIEIMDAYKASKSDPEPDPADKIRRKAAVDPEPKKPTDRQHTKTVLSDDDEFYSGWEEAGG